MTSFEDLSIINLILIILGVYNVIVFLVYGFDKIIAGGRARRISEKTLLVLALLGGSVGALFGMYLFRHKTRKTSFQFWMFLIFFYRFLMMVF